MEINRENRTAFMAVLPSGTKVSELCAADVSDVDCLGVEYRPDGEKVMRLPKGDMSLKEIFSALAGVDPKHIRRKMSGAAPNMYAEIAQHELEHYKNKNHDGYDGSSASLKKELEADKAMYNGDHPEEERLIRDARDLNVLVNPDHATGIGLPNTHGKQFPDYNPIKMSGAAEKFSTMVTAHLIADGHIQTANDLKELQHQNPEIVYGAVVKLKKAGAFNVNDTSVDRYVREYADRYIGAMEKWVVTSPHEEEKIQMTQTSTNNMAP